MRYIVNIVVFITFFIISIMPLHSDKLSNIPSAFIDVGLGARAMGMGGAATALSHDATSLIANPANMMLSDHRYDINAEYTDLYTLYNYSFFGATGEIVDGLKSGIGFIYSGDEAFSETTILLSIGATGGYIYEYLDFKAMNLTFGTNLKINLASFGNNPDGAFIGESGLNHQVAGSSLGFAFDIGATLFSPDKKNIVGLMWRNPISYQSWNSKNEVGTAKGRYTENLPAQLQIGYVRDETKFCIAIAAEKSLHSDTEDQLALGLEYNLFKNIMDIRAGYSNDLLTGMNKAYSLGVGFNVPIPGSTVTVDVAYQINTIWEKNNTLHVALGYKF
jgi:hypothetical protein